MPLSSAYARLVSLLGGGALALSALVVVGCGGANVGSAARGSSATGGAAGVASTPVPKGPVLQDGDGDDDRLGSRSDPDTDEVFTYGSVAGPSDRRAIVSLLSRYYAAAAAGDGGRACAMLHWLVAEAVVEEHSHGRGPASLRGATCAQVATKVFRQRHRELVEDARTLQVTEVRVRAKKAWVRVHFGPVREVLVLAHREHGAWQMNNLLDAGPI
jgi:hypothetical protein